MTQISSKNPFSLDNKRILVTGASSGIGWSICLALANMGAEIVGVARDRPRLNELLEQLLLISDKNHKCISADLLLSDSLDLITSSLSLPLDGIVHSAGISKLSPIRQVNQQHINDINGINVDAPLLLTQKILAKSLINSGGSIVFISSIAAHIGVPGVGVYSGSKAFLIAASRCLALEVIKRKIRVNCLSPAIVDTPLLHATVKVRGSDSMAELESKYPLGFGRPDDVSNACIFYLSDASRWITGTTLILDGGLTIS